MKSATDEVITYLKERGYRITDARKRTIDVLCKQEQPIQIQKLCSLVKGIDEASVYRTISMLLAEHFLEEIVLPGEASRFAFSDGHHHHAICTSCGIMEHIECVTEALPIPQSFKKIVSHEMTLYGLCKKCA
jgi:Fur family transcriptional regulator, peroxide stress response regulator